MNGSSYPEALFPVPDLLAKRYREGLAAALESPLPEGAEPMPLAIDRLGFAPRLVPPLDPSHLALSDSLRLGVILSPDQKRAPLVFSRGTIDECVSRSIYDACAATIADFTRTEPLVVTISHDTERVDDLSKLESYGSVTVTLDTCGRAIPEILELVSLSDGLDVAENLFSESYVSRMLELVARHGDIRHRGLDRAEVSTRFERYRAEVLGGVWYYGDLPKRETPRGSARESDLMPFVVHRSDSVPEGERGCVSAHGLVDPDLLTVLERLGLAELDATEARARSAIASRENWIFAGEGIDVDRLRAPDRKKARVRCYSKFGPTLEALFSFLEHRPGARKREIAVPPLARAALTVPADPDDLVTASLLAELSPDDVLNGYRHDRSRLRRDHASFTPEQKRLISVLNSNPGGS